MLDVGIAATDRQYALRELLLGYLFLAALPSGPVPTARRCMKCCSPTPSMPLRVEFLVCHTWWEGIPT